MSVDVIYWHIFAIGYFACLLMKVHVIPVVNDEADLLHDYLNLGIGVFLCVHSFMYCLLCEPVDPEEEDI